MAALWACTDGGPDELSDTSATTGGNTSAPDRDPDRQSTKSVVASPLPETLPDVSPATTAPAPVAPTTTSAVPAPTTTSPQQPTLVDCEGLDMSLVPGTMVALGGTACSWPWALVVYADAQPRVNVALIRQDAAGRVHVAGWTDVDDGPDVSNYSVDAITAHGVPAATAQLLFDALGGATAQGSAAAPPYDSVAPAACISLPSMEVGMSGHRDQVTLFQNTLQDLGFDPGDLDGYFGENTFGAAAREVAANGDPDTEISLRDGWVSGEVFQRLRIEC